MLNAPIRVIFFFLLVSFLSSQTVSARILMPENAGNYNQQLISSLFRIQGIRLEIRNGYLTSPAFMTELSSSWNPLSLTIPVSYNGTVRYSSAARRLLFEAIESPNTYKVKATGAVPLGKAGRQFRLMELNFSDISGIVYRGIPRAAFDSGMIFLHELVHLYLGLSDPTIEQAKQDPYVKGKTVEFMNKIENQLGVPERRHYYPIPISRNTRPRYSIFFGKDGGRVDLPDPVKGN